LRVCVYRSESDLRHPELANLDRPITPYPRVGARATATSRARPRLFQREQYDFIAAGNAGSACPDYDLQKACGSGLDHLLARR